MALGIRTIFQNAANVLFTNSAVLGTIGLITAVAANQQMKIRAWVMFTVGATGGVRLQVITPAAPVLTNLTVTIINTVAPAQTLVSGAAFGVVNIPLANAGTHWAVVECDFVNGVNAGNVDLQVAQNTADALTLTVLRGSSMEVVTT